MLRIGHFSRITGIPVKTLRYYDEIGLLSPHHIDSFTGYRYYALEQWQRLNRILALKECGLTLEQISQVLDDGVPRKELLRILEMNLLQLLNEKDEIDSKLLRIDRRIHQIETENSMSELEIVIKSVDALPVLSLRHSSSGHFPTLFKEVKAKVLAHAKTYKAQATGPLMGVYYEDLSDPDCDCDFEVAFPTTSSLPESGEFTTCTLPAVEKMASLVYQGSDDRNEVDKAYDAMFAWIDKHGYVVDGPYREIFPQAHSVETATEAIFEIQFPVKKK